MGHLVLEEVQVKVIKRKVTKSQARVAIAQDIIQWIKAKQLNVIQRRYCESVDDIIPTSGGARENIEILKKCQVCALGACLLATINKLNKIDMKDLVENYNNYDTVGVVDVDKMRIYLRKVFTLNQMTLIESAFERHAMFDDNTTYVFDEYDNDINGFDYKPNHPINKAIDFGKRYNNDEERLEAIMTNIIKNNGTFIP